MNNIRERLVECFTIVFPTLTSEEAILATADNVFNWDSVQHLTLMRVVEEAFEIEIPEEVLAGIDSFAGFEQYLSEARNRS